MNKKTIFFVFILFWTVSGITFAQTMQELRVGGFFSGNLRPGQEIWYSIRATETGILTVETTGDTDTYLEAYDSNRNFISENDDGTEDYNAQLNIFASAGRTYLFKLKGYNGEVSGSYRIFASQRQIIELRTGTPYNGNIVSYEEYWFSVNVTQNGILVMETFGNVDTMLVAYNNKFELIGSDDDGGTDYNARFQVEAQAGATFLFLLKGYDDASGPYRIIADVKPYPTPARLNPGSSFSGYISEGEDYWFSVQITRRGRLSVGTMGETDTYLYAYTDAHELITENDDGEDLNAFITIPVEANRTYIFKLRGYDSAASGPYRIIASLE